MRRKILVIEDEPSIRNIIYILLSALDCEGEVAHTGQQALAMIKRESFDVVLLDLRSSDQSLQQVAHKIQTVKPNLMGRVLVVTGEVSDPDTFMLIERNCTTRVQRTRLMHELWERLRVLIGPTEPAHTAR